MIKQKQIAQKIRELRKGRGLSQAELAKRIGVSRVTVTQIESGQRYLDALELAEIAKVFNISTDSILSEERPMKTGRMKMAKNKNIKFDRKKLKNTILYILEKCGGKPNLGETVLYKLLYFIDFDSFELYGKPVTGMSYVKLQYGPVPRAQEYNAVVREMLKSNELKIITQEYHGMMQKRYIALVDVDKSALDDKEKNIIEEVISLYSNMNARSIENYVHGDAPWQIAREKEIIPYNLVFEREAPYAHFDYNKMWQDASAQDVLKDLGPISKEEYEYYENL